MGDRVGAWVMVVVGATVFAAVGLDETAAAMQLLVQPEPPGAHCPLTGCSMQYTGHPLWNHSVPGTKPLGQLTEHGEPADKSSQDSQLLVQPEPPTWHWPSTGCSVQYTVHPS
mgnify:CR=1 FL=1